MTSRSPSLLDRPGVRLAIFAAASLVVFTAAVGVGALVRDASAPADPDHGSMRVDRSNRRPAHAAGHRVPSDGDGLGLTPSAGDLSLVLDSFDVAVGEPVLRFHVMGADGPVTRYDIEQTKRLHLIVVRSDLTGFQHVHPRLGDDGAWSVPVALGTAGTWRVVADFTPSGGERTVLATSIQVGPGRFIPRALPTPVPRVRIDGYEIAIDVSSLEPGTIGRWSARIVRGDAPIAKLEPYLGALAHATILREGDLAYVHAHPVDDAGGDAERLTFETELPSAARYRAFLEFQTGGALHTVAFTIDATTSHMRHG